MTQSVAEQPVTSPKEFLGHDLGEDYYLANYQELMAYWSKLDEESDRLRVVSIGTTAEGRQQLMGIVTSVENHEQLSRYREISRRLAFAEGINAELARSLAEDGKAVVWIDGGLHATEVLCAQALMETMYRFLRDDDPETLRILDDVIILFVHANPDGMDLVSDWYMRNEDPKQRSLAGLPRLYQKYIGHDNNRDFFANTQAETRNMNYTMYLEWLPQIVYNQHQTGPAGTVLFCPPFRDPFNYNIDPLVVNGIDSVGAAMMQRFLVEGMPGATCRSGARYSTWWNGGLRTTAYFHNMIGLLTETIGTPTPSQVRIRAEQQLPKGDYLAPIEPQEWHFRQSVEYSVVANKAVLDYASRHREQLLYNIWHMGNEAIERGNRDSWTITPSLVKNLRNRGSQRSGNSARSQGRGRQNRGGRGALTAEQFQAMFRVPENRDPRGFIVPANQTDFLTATKFVNILIGTGVIVHQATEEFEV
ncbi:MAG: M14 family metallopeptidase, partial [Pirellulales bacterium]|nr:M14 family metallopeptidase [Pirellulales bacterium]